MRLFEVQQALNFSEGVERMARSSWASRDDLLSIDGFKELLIAEIGGSRKSRAGSTVPWKFD
jgi:hypothetical protein